MSESDPTPGTDALSDERYINLATFRRDGREVRTPVWFVALEQRLYCFSAGNAGKVKRIRANGRARVAACDMRGTTAGPWFEGTARGVAESALVEQVYAALRRKYGWQMYAGDFFAHLTRRYQRRAVLEIRA